MVYPNPSISDVHAEGATFMLEQPSWECRCFARFFWKEGHPLGRPGMQPRSQDVTTAVFQPETGVFHIVMGVSQKTDKRLISWKIPLKLGWFESGSPCRQVMKQWASPWQARSEHLPFQVSSSENGHEFIRYMFIHQFRIPESGSTLGSSILEFCYRMKSIEICCNQL